MEELRNVLKKELEKHPNWYTDKEYKISYIIGYSRDDETIKKEDALDVIFEIMQGKI